VSRATGPRGLLQRATAHPLDSLRTARQQRLRVAVMAIDHLPGPIRRGIARPIDPIARGFLRRSGEHPLAAPVHLIALRAAGRGGEARTEARQLAADGGPRTVARVARVVLAFGDAGLADSIVNQLPNEPDDRSTTALRGEIDYRIGRYASALDRLERATAAGADGPMTRLMIERSRSELVVLAPGWRPDIGPATPLADRVPGRVLHLLTNSLPYRQAGYTVRAQSVARCQQAYGLDPVMATRAGFPRSDGVTGGPPLDVVDGVTYHRLRPELDPAAGPERMATETAQAAVALIRDLRPSVLQPTTNHLNGQIGLALGARFGIPVVYEVRGFLEETWLSRMGAVAADSDRYLAARAAETAVMDAADAVVTLSETMRTDILARSSIAPDRVVVVPNGVDVDRFVPGPRDAGLAASLGIAPDETVIGYISSFTSYEGIEYLIRAAALLRERGRRIRLLLVGDGEARADLEAVAHEVGVDDGTAIFTGRVPHADVLRYYRTIDIFVVPRTNDRVSQLVTPLKPYEAMAMEKALVVSAVGALLEIVTDGETGRSFTPEDAVSLTDVLEPLLADPAERARLGAAAREWVTANRTWDQNGARYRALFDHLGVT